MVSLPRASGVNYRLNLKLELVRSRTAVEFLIASGCQYNVDTDTLYHYWSLRYETLMHCHLT